ncbi:TPR repeat-containing thioredoxin TTL1 [Carex littledalei]|uniref:TPR repeat-containing thioredoxin TTL1 n=1 Tax=Carex littledalei TaxID=544730 RepID=A0A833VIL0_9POAL|nr:TPR repeat-containing thioredoxin TTL1 [Carex littledalei]
MKSGSENAVEAARQAHILDPLNDEVTTIEEHVHMVQLARDKGDNMFRSGKYIEASEKYLIGLNYDWPNIVLLCKLATCHFRLGLWEKCIKNFDNAFKFSQNNPVAPCLFANPFAELEKRDQSVKDYEEQVALKASLGVEEVNSIEQYKDAISASGPIIIFFMDPSKAECIEFSSFVESLCTSFPSANFLKVLFSVLTGIIFHPCRRFGWLYQYLEGGEVLIWWFDLSSIWMVHLGLTGLVILSGTCRVAWILPCSPVESLGEVMDIRINAFKN